MIQYIKRDKPFLLPIIIGCTVLMWLGSLLHPAFEAGHFEKYPMPLYGLLLRLPHQASTLTTSLCLVLLLVQGYLLNNLNAKFRLIEEGTYLPGFFFLLITSSVHELHQLNPLLFANIFLLLSFQTFFPTFRVEKYLDPFFVGAFLISIASLFYFPMIFMIVAMLYFMVTTRSFYWREWAVAGIGLAIPYIITSSIYYLLDGFSGFLTVLGYQFAPSETSSPTHVAYIVFFWMLSFIMVVSVVYLFSNVIKKVVVRKYHVMLLYLWLIGLLVYLFVNPVATEIAYVIAIPFSFYTAHYLSKNKRAWISVCFLFATLIMSLICLLS